MKFLVASVGEPDIIIPKIQDHEMAKDLWGHLV